MVAISQHRPAAREEFKEEPMLARSYGAHSWRGEQSIIDILQNHLDANEKNGVTTPPRMSVQVSRRNGESRWIGIDALDGTNHEWQITGFRVHDQGRGFDHGFLGVMGASTKETDTKSRGGLGEGLKMCIANLLREGANVRLATISEFGTWHAKGVLRDNAVTFEGTELANQKAERKTGAITEVTAARESAVAQTLRGLLDTREGKGIGELVLDYRKQAIDVHKDGRIPEMKGGRVFVKGLWICEKPGLLNSYNLGERWSIEGRDRKTVKEDALVGAIHAHLGSMTEATEIRRYLELVDRGASHFEMSCFNEALATRLKSPEAWRAAVKEYFGLTSNQVILSPSYLEAAQSHALHHDSINPRKSDCGSKFFGFVDALFPNEVLTFAALKRRDQKFESQTNQLAGSHADEVPKDLLRQQPSTAPPPSSEANRDDRTTPALIARDTLVNTLSQCRDVPRRIIERLRDIPIIWHEGPAGSPFVNGDAGALCITREVTGADKVAIFSHLLNLAVGSHTPNIASQDLANKLLGLAALSYDGRIPKLDLNSEERPNAAVLKRRDERRAEARAELAVGRRAEDLLRRCRWNKEEIIAVRPEFTARHLDTLPVRDGDKFVDVAGNKILAREVPLLEGFPVIDESIYEQFLQSAVAAAAPIPPELVATPSLAIQHPAPEGQLEHRSIYARLLQDNLPAMKFAPQIEQIREQQTSTYVFDPKTHPSYRITTKGVTEKEYVVTAEERHGELHTTIYGEGYYSEFRGRGRVQTPDFQIIIGFGALQVQGTSYTVSKYSPNAETNQDTHSTDRYRGKSTICSSLTLSYGSHNWDKPEKALIDCLQNHIDANRGERPKIEFIVQHPDGRKLHVRERDLRKLPTYWKVLQFSISDDGDGFFSHHLAVMGDSTKGAKERGRYGEGLKLILNACTRNGVELKVSSRDWVATPKKIQRRLTDYQDGSVKEYQLLGFDMKWLSSLRGGSASTFTHQDGSDEKFWNELVTAVDPRVVSEENLRGIDRFFITEKPLIQVGDICVYKRRGIYEKGLKVETKKLNNSFGYNFYSSLTTTRERNDFNTFKAGQTVEKLHRSLFLDPRYARQAVIRDVSGNKSFESMKSFDSSAKSAHAAVFIAFEEVFGKNAVLSVGPILESKRRYRSKLYASLLEDPSPAARVAILRDLEKKIPELERVYANEPHLAGRFNLVSSVFNSTFSQAGIQSTAAFQDIFDSRDVDLAEEQSAAALEAIAAADKAALGRIQRLREHGMLGALEETLSLRRENVDREVARRDKSDIVWRAQTWGLLGGCLRDGRYAYNVSLLDNPPNLYATHLHELAHRLTGLADYNTEFQQMLLLLGPDELLFG